MPEPAAEPELLWPRWAGRLEAAGEVGVARCYLHNLAAGDPLCVPAATPRPRTEGEALALATEALRRVRAVAAAAPPVIGPTPTSCSGWRGRRPRRAQPYLEEAAARGARRSRRRPRVREDGRVPVAEIEAICEQVGLRR